MRLFENDNLNWSFVLYFDYFLLNDSFFLHMSYFGHFFYLAICLFYFSYFIIIT